MALFNPFSKFTVATLESCIGKENYFLAVQHFKRGFPYYSPSNKTCLLLTPYPYKYRAERHLEELKDKRYCALVDLRHQKHVDSINTILEHDSPYILFDGSTDLIAPVLKRSTQYFEPKLIRYLNREVDIDLIKVLKTNLQITIIYGEIYILLGEGIDQLKMKLETIENM